jgi:hypothetical protein
MDEKLPIDRKALHSLYVLAGELLDLASDMEDVLNQLPGELETWRAQAEEIADAIIALYVRALPIPSLTTQISDLKTQISNFEKGA